MINSQIYYFFRILKTTFTPFRIFNALKLEISYRLSVIGVSTNWKLSPFFISIEPVNVCNLHCPECPTGMQTKNVKPTNIDDMMTRNVIDELQNTLTHVIFYFQGEPLLNRNFTNLVNYAYSKKLLTSTSTNAQLINDEMAKRIVQSGLDRIIISMDGTTQETYQKYRVGGKLDKTIQAVEFLVKWKRELKSPSPFIEIQFLVLKTNEHQMPEMKILAKKLKADKLSFKTAQLYDFENGNMLLPENKKYSRYELLSDGKYHLKNPLHNRCKRQWKGAVVTSRGDVLPCCFDKDSSFVFGNLNEKSFEDCHDSEKALKFREKIRQNRKQFEMCRNCTEK